MLGAGERRGRTDSLESSAWESTRTNRGEAEDRVDYAIPSVGQIADSNPALGTTQPKLVRGFRRRRLLSLRYSLGNLFSRINYLSQTYGCIREVQLR